MTNIFQWHNNLFSKATKTITYDDLINYIHQESDNNEKSCRLVKISMIESLKKLQKKDLLTDDFKINTKLIKEYGLETIPEFIEYEAIKKKYDDLKKGFPLILCSIHTSDLSTNKSSLSFYNNRIVIDIDNLSIQGINVDEIFEKSKDDIYCELSFISPGGDGLKLFYEVDAPTDLKDVNDFHSFAYNKLREWVKSNYNLDTDSSCSNLNRTCLITKGTKYNYSPDKSTLELYSLYKSAGKSKKAHRVVSKNKKISSNIDYLFDAFIDYFDKNRHNIFSDRNDWVKLSYIIANFKGEEGEALFQKLSSYADNYSQSACSTLYKNSLKTLNVDRLGQYPERWIYKILTDHGYIPKTTDRILKQMRWSEKDYAIMIKELGYSIIEDEITGNQYIQRNDKISPMTDLVFNQLITDLRLNYNDQFKESVLKTYIKSESNIIIKNFIKDRIESFSTDDKTNFELIFENIKCDENDRLVKQIFKRWGLGVIQNIYDTYYDEILVLKSKQGLGKTTWIINYLTKPFAEWTTTSFNYDLKSKDDMKLLADKMFIYDTENMSLKKTDAQVIKRITSTSVIDYRKPYDTYSVSRKRIASFIMDTNEDYIFNDLTGGRRFLILNINSLNIYDIDGGNLKKIDYEKVWGYLYNLYKNGLRPSDIDISEASEYIDNYRLKSDLENQIDFIFEKSNEFNMSLDEVKRHVESHYNSLNMRLHTDGFTDTKIGRIMSQKYDKRFVRVGGVRKTMYTVKLRKNKIKELDEITSKYLKDIFE